MRFDLAYLQFSLLDSIVLVSDVDNFENGSIRPETIAISILIR